MYVLFILEIYFSSMQYFLTTPSPLSTHSRCPSFNHPQIHIFSISSSEKSIPPRDNSQTGQDKTQYNETRQKFSHGGWTRQPNSRKRVSRVKETEQHLLPLLELNQPDNNHNIYTESLVQTLRSPILSTSVSLSPCEPWLADWISHVLVVSSNLSNVYKLFSPSSTGFLHLQREGQAI